MPQPTNTSRRQRTRPDEAGRIRRHPAAIEERAARERDYSEQPDETRPVDAQAHPPPTPPASGTLASVGDLDELSVAEPGLPVEPEDLGIQFLRDATEQDNFESEASRIERAPGAYAMGQLISEGTLEASGQEGNELPLSNALGGPGRDTPSEPRVEDLNLTDNAIRAASLFDEPKGPYEAGDTRHHDVVTDDSAIFDEHRGGANVDEDAREEEKARLRAKLRGGRDRRDVKTDGAAREDNRRRGPSRS
jgi:hypothetical protein